MILDEHMQTGTHKLIYKTHLYASLFFFFAFKYKCYLAIS